MHTQMRRLSEAERAEYDEQGYVVVPGIFTGTELERIDREIDRLLPEVGDERRKGWIAQLGLRSETTGRFAENERLLALLEEIVQPGIAIYSSKLVAKPPHSDTICHWHQDEAFYREKAPPSTCRMSVWVPLQDANEQNGCLWVVPGSHRWGLEEYTDVDNGTCGKKIDREAFANEHAIPVPVEAGSVVLFSTWTWHSSKGNQTDRVRRAFIVSYQEATVPNGNGAQWKILRQPALTSAGAAEQLSGVMA